MEIREQRAQEISAELQGETWENIPELDPTLVDAALNRFETLVLQFDDDVEEMGRKKAWNTFQEGCQHFIISQGLNVKERQKERVQIETILQSYRLIASELAHQREKANIQARPDLHRTREKREHTLETTQEQAACQHRLQIFILSQKNIEGFNEKMERMWGLIEKLAMLNPIDQDWAGKQQRGINRAVTVAEILKRAGFHVVLSTAAQDVKHKIDLWAIKQSKNLQEYPLLCGIQVKPSPANDLRLTIQAVNYKEVPMSEISQQDAWQVINGMQRIQTEMAARKVTLGKVTPLALFIKAPAGRDVAEKISSFSGIPQKEMIDGALQGLDEKTKKMLRIND